MITLFENFNEDIKLRNYIIKKEGAFLMPNLSFKHFSEYYFKHPLRWVPVQYNNIVRFFVYVKLLRYNGSNPIILDYIKGIKERNDKKTEIINKIPNNHKVMKLMSDKFNLDFPIDYNFSDLNQLAKLVNNYKEIFSDENLVEYIRKVEGVTKISDVAEKIVKGMLIHLYGRKFEIIKAGESDDLKDIDFWKIDKGTGDRQALQVKNISGNVQFSLEGDTIYIRNTDLDLHTYITNKDTLNYDYLVFYLEKDKKVCIIKATAIFSIFTFLKTRTIRIKLKKWAIDPEWRDKVIRFVDIPAKFLPKDYDKIFY